MALSRHILIFTVVSFGLFLSSCGHGQNSSVRAVWDGILNRCAATDTLGGDLIYFGPSNKIGLGAIWRVASDGDYRLRWTLEDGLPNASQKDSVLKRGLASTCIGNQSTSLGIDGSMVLDVKVPPISAELTGELKKAKNVSASINSWALDQLEEGPFEELLASLSKQNAYRLDLEKEDRVLITRAVRVSGLTATLEFASEDAVALKAKYTGPTMQLGSVGTSFKVDWKDNTHLQLSSDGEFVILGGFSKYFPKKGFGIGQPVFEPVIINRVPSLAQEMP